MSRKPNIGFVYVATLGMALSFHLFYPLVWFMSHPRKALLNTEVLHNPHRNSFVSETSKRNCGLRKLFREKDDNRSVGNTFRHLVSPNLVMY
uniref:Putative secreted peptide n=1 Tax=Anopheles braziliensis TaxID=58242 RepID=A0A2M3ZTP1_9DIPT